MVSPVPQKLLAHVRWCETHAYPANTMVSTNRCRYTRVAPTAVDCVVVDAVVSRAIPTADDVFGLFAEDSTE